MTCRRTQKHCREYRRFVDDAEAMKVVETDQVDADIAEANADDAKPSASKAELSASNAEPSASFAVKFSANFAAKSTKQSLHANYTARQRSTASHEAQQRPSANYAASFASNARSLSL